MRIPRSFLAGVSVASLIFAVPVAMAATDGNPNTYDGTSPSLTLKPLEFAVGSSIDAAAPVSTECTNKFWNMEIPVLLRWTATDRVSGIDGVDVFGGGGGFAGVRKLATFEGTSTTSFPFNGTNYDGTCGGGGFLDRELWVEARDVRGNSASSRAVPPDGIDLWDENGVNTMTSAPDLARTQTGTWKVSNCACFNNGSTLHSSTPGASITYTLTSVRPGQTVAVVMPTNTNRGVVKIGIDGGESTAVNTYSATSVNRVIVWQRTLSAGKHTLRLVNAGTAGRPRIDIDTIMMTSGGGGLAPQVPETS
jgi:hypothetical protein